MAGNSVIAALRIGMAPESASAHKVAATGIARAASLRPRYLPELCRNG